MPALVLLALLLLLLLHHLLSLWVCALARVPAGACRARYDRHCWSGSLRMWEGSAVGSLDARWSWIHGRILPKEAKLFGVKGDSKSISRLLAVAMWPRVRGSCWKSEEVVWCCFSARDTPSR